MTKTEEVLNLLSEIRKDVENNPIKKEELDKKLVILYWKIEDINR